MIDLLKIRPTRFDEEKANHPRGTLQIRTEYTYNYLLRKEEVDERKYIERMLVWYVCVYVCVSVCVSVRQKERICACV